MTPSEKKKLAKQIRQLCEKQYRKGFHQGFYACRKNKLTLSQVDDFRTKGSVQDYKKIVDPHNGQKYGSDKLVCEIPFPDHRELISLLNDTHS